MIFIQNYYLKKKQRHQVYNISKNHIKQVTTF